MFGDVLEKNKLKIQKLEFIDVTGLTKELCNLNSLLVQHSGGVWKAPEVGLGWTFLGSWFGNGLEEWKLLQNTPQLKWLLERDIGLFLTCFTLRHCQKNNNLELHASLNIKSQAKYLLSLAMI